MRMPNKTIAAFLLLLGSSSAFPTTATTKKVEADSEEEAGSPCSYLRKLRGQEKEVEEDHERQLLQEQQQERRDLATCGGPNGSSRPVLSPDDLGYFLGFVDLYRADPGLLIYDQSLGDTDPWTNWYLEPDLRNQIAKLSVQRGILEKYNLYDTYVPGYVPSTVDCSNIANTKVRQADGTCNDLLNGNMGAAGARFGRNMLPLSPAAQVNDATLLSPSPREVSRKLFARPENGSPKEVDFLNMLGTAWIQFQIHDWFNHETSTSNSDVYQIPLAADDPFRVEEGLDTLKVRRTPHDNSSGPSFGPAFKNDVTHWWDGSQIYGSDAATVQRLRSGQGGRLAIGSDGLLPKSSSGDGFDDTGFRDNWWVGLGIFHTLFAKEHNAIADRLANAYPTWSDDEIFDRARMINAALLVKIHTIEWTPAILPSLEVGMNINWGGLNQYLDPPLPKEYIEANIPHLASVMNGLAGSPRDLKVYPTKEELMAVGVDEQTAAYVSSTFSGEVPFSLTEEFVSVYRMHPLLPDVLKLHDVRRQQREGAVPLKHSLNADARDLMESRGMANLLYSFGVEKSQQLGLQNFPQALQNLDVPGLGKVDLGTVDLLRDRERGLPRYNEFRRQLRLAPISSIDELTDDVAMRAEIKAVYGDDIEAVDALVGFLSESTRPTCFGFGETLFQVFLLMATRRIQGDRFYTDNFTEDTYTPEGMEWIQTNSLKDVLLRHYPELGQTGLAGVTNAFYPWQ